VVSSRLISVLAAATLASITSAIAVGCAQPPPDTEAVGESEDHLLAGDRLTPSDVAAKLRAAGFDESVIGKMVCTAKYESSYYEKATNKNKNKSEDYGLFQINSNHLGDKGCPTSASALFDPDTNTKCAYAVFKAQGINAWYGYQKHKSECDRTRAPAANGTSSSSSSTSGAVTSSSSSSGYYQGPSTSSSSSGAVATDSPQSPDDGMIDANADYDLGAGCWSATKQDTMAPHACVQQASTKVWFQCSDGQWYRGGDDVTGPYGYCNGTYPLQ
jgi:hypothetical protein